MILLGAPVPSARRITRTSLPSLSPRSSLLLGLPPLVGFIFFFGAPGSVLNYARRATARTSVCTRALRARGPPPLFVFFFTSHLFLIGVAFSCILFYLFPAVLYGLGAVITVCTSSFSDSGQALWHFLMPFPFSPFRPGVV